MASCGDVATQEALAATAILREHLPELKVRFVNVVDLFKLQPATEHPHGSTEHEFEQRLHDQQADHLQLPRPSVADSQAHAVLRDMHVHGYREKGNINTPLELALLNETSRFHLVIDVLDRVPALVARVGTCARR